ncbi:major facilitator superfamily domain-containing protein [Xylariales sp. PMI_506]|nr:major facilitator superfamily domain-containing protein [Xylariales sp. PMI_506]
MVTYPRGFRLISIVTALVLSIFLISLDQGIVATAVPRITDQFGVIDDIGWYGSGYLLMSASQLLLGKLYTIFPIKTVFITSIAIFEVGSLICGLAPSSAVLIVGRVIAGLGGSGIFSGVFILVAHTVPISQRPLYAAIDSATFGLGSVMGPLLGGAFTDKLTWRWCFYINLPFGVLAIVLVFFLIKNSKSSDSGRETAGSKRTLVGFDSVSFMLLIAAIVCILFALQWGGLRYAWNSARIVVLLVLFVILVSGFILVQRWVPEAHSSLPTQVLHQRSVVSGCIYYAGWGGGFMPLSYFLPVWFQTIKGASAFQSGIMTIPLVLAYVIASVVGGIAVTRVGYYTPFMIASSLLMAVGAGLISTLAPESSPGEWIGFQVTYGIGLGLGADLPLVAAQTVLPLIQIPRATALLLLTQTVSATVFISVCQSVFGNRLLVHLRKVIPGLGSETIIDMGVISLKSLYDADGSHPEFLAAYNAAMHETFLVSVIMATITMLGSLGMEWKSVKATKSEEKISRDDIHSAKPDVL